MKKLSLSVAIIGIIATANNVMAWNRPNAVTLTPSLGYYHFNSKRHADNTVIPNFALTYNFDERWAAELSYSVLNTDYHNATGLRGVLYTFDGIYRFSPCWYLQPYAIAGIGMIGLKPQLNNQNQYQGNVNLGLGTQLFADKMVALRFEVKDLYYMAGGANDMSVSFGVSFQFG